MPAPTRGAKPFPNGTPRPPQTAVSARTPGDYGARHRLAPPEPVPLAAVLPARIPYPTGRPRERFPWLAALMTVALVGGAVLTIVVGPAAPLQAPPVTRTPAVAPLAPVTPPPAVTMVVGKNANAGSDCADVNMPGVDENGSLTACRETPDGLRWVRRK